MRTHTQAHRRTLELTALLECAGNGEERLLLCSSRSAPFARSTACSWWQFVVQQPYHHQSPRQGRKTAPGAAAGTLALITASLTFSQFKPILIFFSFFFWFLHCSWSFCQRRLLNMHPRALGFCCPLFNIFKERLFLFVLRKDLFYLLRRGVLCELSEKIWVEWFFWFSGRIGHVQRSVFLQII